MHPSLSGEGKFLVRGYRPNQQASGCLTLRSFEEAEVEAFRPHKPSMSTYRQSLMEMEAMEAARHVAPSVFSTLFFFSHCDFKRSPPTCWSRSLAAVGCGPSVQHKTLLMQIQVRKAERA